MRHLLLLPAIFLVAPTDSARISEVGQWDLIGRSGVSAMHATLLPTNEVLFLERVQMITEAVQPDGTPGYATLFNLTTNTIRVLSTPSNLFCSAGSFLPNGTLVSMGGAEAKGNVPEGLDGLRYFTPCADGACDWERGIRKAISTTRWYPTAESLADGRIVLIGGSHVGTGINTPDIFVPTLEIHPENGLPDRLEVHPLPFLNETLPYNLYPVTHLLPDGSLFLHASSRSIILDTTTWTQSHLLPTLPGPPRSYPLSGGSILLPLRPEDGYAPSVLICGGSSKYSVNAVADTTCGRLSLAPWMSGGGGDAKAGKWEVDTMPLGRMMPDMFTLADGSVLILNGAATGVAGFYKAKDPVLHPLIYSPDAPHGSRWSRMAPSLIPRMYHSVALLLPDGRVMVAGSNPNKDQQPEAVFNTEYRVEAFSPPYLHTGRPRPEILHAPDKVRLGERFNIRILAHTTSEAGEWKAALVQGGFVTHSTHMSHRWVGLEVIGITAEGTMTLVAPPSAAIAPRGTYMLFLLERGVPSISRWVKLEAAV